jgi:ribosomal protein S18 acetylase RimI-like enzyme
VELSALTSPDRAAFVDLMGAAFEADPWFATLFGPAVDRRRDFLAFLFDLSLWTGAELRGLRESDRLLGATVLETPDVRHSAWPRVVLRALTGRIGLTWRNVRPISAYLRQTRAALPRGRSYYLSLIGVDPAVRGLGHGRTMLESILGRVSRDTSSIGIGLDTENDANVALYERFGFVVMRTTRVGAVAVHSLFRSR